MALTWLHLSDFHIPSYDSYDRDVVLRALVSSIGGLHESGRRPSLIFATGDLGASGQQGEYEMATRLFDDLLTATGLERQHLFVIPGNHDVDRDQGVGLARSLASQEESDAYFAPGRAIPHLTQKQEAFYAWYAEFFAGVRDCPTSSCGPVERIELDGRRIAILPVNSALFCQDDNDHAKLWIGRRSLDEALSSIGDADLRIALMHHPLDWLADAERSNVRAALTGGVDFVLRGHLHDTEIEQVVSRHGNMMCMAAGAAYQTRRWPNRALYATLDGSSLAVFPIRYEDSPKEIWTVDPSVFPEEENYTGMYDLRPAFPAGDAGTSAPAGELRAAPTFRSNVPSTRGLRVVGRDSELEEMAGVFADLSSEQILVLTGTPGVGKSELAREFARRHKERYPGGTFFIDATSADILVDLARIGPSFLGIEFPENLKLEEQCQRTLVALGAAPTLLIYDNVHSFEGIERWLPPAGMSCHVVITTVHEPTALGWQRLDVEPLSPEHSEDLITALAGSEVAGKYGAALASHAGGLPVQLCPVAAVLAYEERRGRAADQHLSSLADEAHESFWLVYELLDQPVRLLLHAVLGLNPQRIDRAELAAHLETGAGWTEAEINAALDACRDVHLLEGDARLRMHQLLASFLQSIPLPDDLGTTLGEIRKAQRERLKVLAKALSENPADGSLATDLLGFRLAPEDWDQLDAPLPAEVREPLALALISIGEYDEARPWYEQAVEEKHQGDEGHINHGSLGTSIHQVGYCHSATGEYKEARSWYERAVEEKRQGDAEGRIDHQSLGSSLHQVGFCYSETGEHKEARSWYERAVEEARQGDVHGRISHEGLGTSIHQVGTCYSESGEYKEARSWYERAVEEKRQGDIHGRVDNQSLGTSIHQAGYCHSVAGEYKEARSWYERAVEEKRQGDIHGRVDHERLRSSLLVGAQCLRRVGEAGRAAEWEAEARSLTSPDS